MSDHKDIAWITINQETFDRLSKAYKRARERGERTFMFNGHEVLTEYAKYLLQYMQAELKGAPQGRMTIPQTVWLRAQNHRYW